MRDTGARPAKGQIIFQCTIGVAALGGLTFAPPAAGRMAIVPLTPGAALAAPAMAAASGAMLIGPGKLPGSLVVQGDRASLLGAALRSGSLLVSPTMAGCAR